MQNTLAPFLRHGVLRRIVMTLGNNSSTPSSGSGGTAAASLNAAAGSGGGAGGGEVASGLEAWACNPRVVELLSRARELLETGAMSERQLEHHLVSQLKARGRGLFVTVACVNRPTSPTHALASAPAPCMPPPASLLYFCRRPRTMARRAPSFTCPPMCRHPTALPRPSLRPPPAAASCCPRTSSCLRSMNT